MKVTIDFHTRNAAYQTDEGPNYNAIMETIRRSVMVDVDLSAAKDYLIKDANGNAVGLVSVHPKGGKFGK